MNKPHELPQQAAFAQVGVALPHESAHLHVAGAAPYTDDLPELAGTLHAALGLSPIAHGVIEELDLHRIRAMPGVVDLFTARDIPGANDCGSLVHDEPILAGDVGAELRYLGQPVFAVIATTVKPRAAPRRRPRTPSARAPCRPSSRPKQRTRRSSTWCRPCTCSVAMQPGP